jgi:gluconokinase
MAREALNDQDRLPWLGRLREFCVRKLEEEVLHRRNHSGEATTEDAGLVLACSSLKGYYRQILRGVLTVEREPEAHPGEVQSYQDLEADQQTPPPSLPLTYFVWVKGDKEAIRDRMLKREGHFFKPNMLDGQFEALESPEGEPDVVVVSLEPPTEEQTDMALEGLGKMAKTRATA